MKYPNRIFLYKQKIICTSVALWSLDCKFSKVTSLKCDNISEHHIWSCSFFLKYNSFLVNLKNTWRLCTVSTFCWLKVTEVKLYSNSTHKQPVNFLNAKGNHFLLPLENNPNKRFVKKKLTSLDLETFKSSLLLILANRELRFFTNIMRS